MDYLSETRRLINFTTEFLSKDRTLRPGWSWRKGYGTAAIDGFNFMVNTAVPLGPNTELYAFGGRNFRDTDAYAFQEVVCRWGQQVSAKFVSGWIYAPYYF